MTWDSYAGSFNNSVKGTGIFTFSSSFAKLKAEEDLSTNNYFDSLLWRRGLTSFMIGLTLGGAATCEDEGI